MDERVDFGFVSATETARILKCCENTLQRWRAKGEGPAFCRIGGRVFYSRSLLEQFVRAQTCNASQLEVA